MMPSFKTIFSTKTLLRVIAVLMTAVAMKALSLHYDFSWAAAMTAN